MALVGNKRCKEAAVAIQLWLGVVFAAPLGEAGAELSVADFKFDGPLGSDGAVIEKIGTNHFKMTLGHAPGHPTWANNCQFQIVRNAKGNSLTLDVVFLGGNEFRFNEYFHSWSYDGKNWTPIHWERDSKDSKEGDTLKFPVFEQDTVYCGLQVPMSYEDLVEMVGVWEKNPNVKVYIIGRSVGKRNIYRLEVTDPKSPVPEEKRWVHYFTNQHPGEHNAQWRMVGMLEWLLSDEGADLRRRSICHFLIMTSPDAPSHGWYRTNSEGSDMNRAYRPAGSNRQEQTHEPYLCQVDFEKIMASKAPATSCWSFHTWGGVVDPIFTSGPEIGKIIGPASEFAQILERNDPNDLVKPLSYRKEAKYGSTSWTDGPHMQFGITTILCEGAAVIYTKEKNMESGGVLIKSLAEYWKGTKP